MKTMLYASALAALMACGTATAAEKIVLLGDEDYPPYAYVEGGVFKGLYIDLLKQATDQLKPAYEVDLQPVPWKRAKADVESGAALGMFPPYRHPKERPWIEPYSVAMYKEVVVLVCHADVVKAGKKNFPADFKGTSVGKNTGFASPEALDAASQAGTITISEAKGNEANLRKLATHRIDCYSNDRGSIAYTLKKLKDDADFAGFKPVEVAELGGEEAYVGYSLANKSASKADFVAKLNAAIEGVKKSGAFAKIVDSYLK
ncbi:MAG: hypothetical protein JWQ11_2230 [Rhizobacter sp.]|nr:hypothetical protein [Rhizobacter sp.]